MFVTPILIAYFYHAIHLFFFIESNDHLRVYEEFYSPFCNQSQL